MFFIDDVYFLMGVNFSSNVNSKRSTPCGLVVFERPKCAMDTSFGGTYHFDFVMHMQ